MFDTSKSGTLSRTEFEQMVKVTVSLSLERLLSTTVGERSFEQQLQREYSQENLDFWRAAEEYARMDNGAQRLARARQLHQQYIVDGAREQVVPAPCARLQPRASSLAPPALPSLAQPRAADHTTGTPSPSPHHNLTTAFSSQSPSQPPSRQPAHPHVVQRTLTSPCQRSRSDQLTPTSSLAPLAIRSTCRGK